MHRNIAMKFAGYMARILLCKQCKFSDKIYYNSKDIKFSLGDYFLLARPVTRCAASSGRKMQINKFRLHKCTEV